MINDKKVEVINVLGVAFKTPDTVKRNVNWKGKGYPYAPLIIGHMFQDNEWHSEPELQALLYSYKLLFEGKKFEDESVLVFGQDPARSFAKGTVARGRFESLIRVSEGLKNNITNTDGFRKAHREFRKNKNDNLAYFLKVLKDLKLVDARKIRVRGHRGPRFTEYRLNSNFFIRAWVQEMNQQSKNFETECPYTIDCFSKFCDMIMASEDIRFDMTSMAITHYWKSIADRRERLISEHETRARAISTRKKEIEKRILKNYYGKQEGRENRKSVGYPNLASIFMHLPVGIYDIFSRYLISLLYHGASIHNKQGSAYNLDWGTFGEESFYEDLRTIRKKLGVVKKSEMDILLLGYMKTQGLVEKEEDERSLLAYIAYNDEMIRGAIEPLFYSATPFLKKCAPPDSLPNR